ncbi:MAG: NAD(P) transhydrogenase subunit alpha [Terrimicrobiaceae bacterium]|nr:NAD(P) transhydrogenase subunit alpha [Terrimicrobiaceae bacterium]
MPVLFCPKESHPPDSRVALTPETARRFQSLGLACAIEAGAGQAAGFPDSEYEAAGCAIQPVRAEGLARADVVVGIHPLSTAEIRLLHPGVVTAGFLDPFRQPAIVQALTKAGVTAISLELVPRTTLAQKMDALSSQASLAGYAAVILAAMRLDKILPMMMTPAGTLQPAKFFIVGVGVAGLQAIATAKRLGARVTAFDTRPVVEEQVKSLGARFLKMDLGETGQTEQGYARELTPEQVELQQRGMARACAESDAVITTAQVFGRPAPRLLTSEMLAGMRPGSVVVDMAVSTGGNVEGSRPGEEVVIGGVRVLGAESLAATVPHHASLAFANNIFHLLAHFWKAEQGFAPAPDDEIARSAIVCRDRRIVSSVLSQTQKT